MKRYVAIAYLLFLVGILCLVQGSRAGDLTLLGAGKRASGGASPSPIAFVNVADLGNNGGSGDRTVSYTRTTGNFLALAAVGNTGGAESITATYGGVPLTLCGSVVNQTNQNRNAFLLYIFGPAAGANNFVIHSNVGAFLLAGVAEYSGGSAASEPDASITNISGGFGSPVPASGLTTALTSVTDNAWEILMEQSNGDTPTAGTGSTRRTFDGTFGSWGLFDSGAAITPAGSYSMTTAGRPSANAVVHIACDFHP